MAKLPPITPDDPLGTAADAAAPSPKLSRGSGASRPARARPRGVRPGNAPKIASVADPAPPATSSDEWSGATDVTTFRLPIEVLRLLHERSRRLGIAKGMTAATAILEFLGRDDAAAVAAVEAVQQRYDSARRRARRSM